MVIIRNIWLKWLEPVSNSKRNSMLKNICPIQSNQREEEEKMHADFVYRLKLHKSTRKSTFKKPFSTKKWDFFANIHFADPCYANKNQLSISNFSLEIWFYRVCFALRNSSATILNEWVHERGIFSQTIFWRNSPMNIWFSVLIYFDTQIGLHFQGHRDGFYFYFFYLLQKKFCAPHRSEN